MMLMSAAELLAQRLWSFEPRLRLLFAHLAGRKLRERVEPDDLVQETFLRALGSAHALPPESAGESELWRFLVHLARHVAVDAARALRAAKRAGSEQRLARSDWSTAGPHESQLAARTRGPATRVAEVESLERLAAAYLRLAPEHRRVIGLRQFEGLTAAEAAARMGRSEVAVHSLYRRALEAWESAASPPAARARGSHEP
jgi:RNA polymerase sigma-70 factor (ECF subfamily)